MVHFLLPTHIIFICSDPLSKGVFLAYKARKNFLTGHSTMSAMSCLKQASRAGELLKESLYLKVDFEHKHACVRQASTIPCLACRCGRNEATPHVARF